MIRQFLYFFIQWSWGIVQNVTGLGILAFLKIRKPKRFTAMYHGAIVCEWEKRSSMAMGMFIFLGHDNVNDAYAKRVLVHEYGHTVQSCILGPFYLLLIGLPSILWANVPTLGKKWREGFCSYYDFYPEKWANFEGERMLKMPSPAHPTEPDEM